MIQKKHLAFFMLGLGLVLAAGCLVYIPYDDDYSPRPRRSDDRYEGRHYGDIDTSFFYDYLSSYGIWVYNRPYGHVWIPRNVPYRWRPYTHGRWAWTDYGWTWVSVFEWGWVPFHYGRWGWDRDLGWFWVPGTVWAPAWVAWRWGGYYIGWAPLPPDAEFIVGIGIRRLPFDLPPNYWVFIDGRYFYHSYLDRYVLPYERNRAIINLTVVNTGIFVRNNRVINEGIDIDQVGRLTQTEVRKSQLRDADKPGRPLYEGDQVSIYKPSVKKNEMAQPKNVLEKRQAVERVSKQRLGEPEGRFSPDDAGYRLRKEQEREMRLLEESQDKEKAGLIKKFEEAQSKASSAVEKEKVEKEYEATVESLKKQHQEEKSEIKKRHQEDEEKPTKGKIRKKEGN